MRLTVNLEIEVPEGKDYIPYLKQQIACLARRVGWAKGITCYPSLCGMEKAYDEKFRLAYDLGETEL